MSGVNNTKLTGIKTRIISAVRENVKTGAKTRSEMVKDIKTIIKENS